MELLAVSCLAIRLSFCFFHSSPKTVFIGRAGERGVPGVASFYRENPPGGGRICGLNFHIRGWLGLFWSSHAGLALEQDSGRAKTGDPPEGGESKRSADKPAVSGAKEGGANVAEGICRYPAREFQIGNLASKREF